MAASQSSTVHSKTHSMCPIHRSNIQYFTITLNPVFTQRQVWYTMTDSKSYCTRKMAVSKSRTVHSKTHRVCPINIRNIGPIGPKSSTLPSPWIQSLPKGRSDMPWKIQRATGRTCVIGKQPFSWYSISLNLLWHIRPAFWVRARFKVMV